jgi:hypothetical protein
LEDQGKTVIERLKQQLIVLSPKEWIFEVKKKISNNSKK